MDREFVEAIICNGKHWVVVEMENSAHVMPIEEWQKVYGKLHSEVWKNGKRVREKRKVS